MNERSAWRGWKLGRGLKVAGVLLIVMTVVPLVAKAGFRWWRQGTIVAEASFDPGIAPFVVTVRRVPVPVTDSDHFIVELSRGQYVVTSFRYFWPGYTPERVRIDWPCAEHFTVTFDDTEVATCDWSWGATATWTLTHKNGPTHEAGLSPYFFTPRNPVPAGCRPFKE